MEVVLVGLGLDDLDRPVNERVWAGMPAAVRELDHVDCVLTRKGKPVKLADPEITRKTIESGLGNLFYATTCNCLSFIIPFVPTKVT
jgi:hypothetical protein